MEIDSVAELARLNERITEAENKGGTPEAQAFLNGLLATSFAFRRAGGEVVDRAGFLGALTTGGDRAVEYACEVRPLGVSRALATCVVHMTVGGGARRFDNARLFVRDKAGDWKLLAWANEPML
jgi:hypothetical protein